MLQLNLGIVTMTFLSSPFTMYGTSLNLHMKWDILFLKWLVFHHLIWQFHLKKLTFRLTFSQDKSFIPSISESTWQGTQPWLVWFYHQTRWVDFWSYDLIEKFKFSGKSRKPIQYLLFSKYLRVLSFGFTLHFSSISEVFVVFGIPIKVFEPFFFYT